MGKHEKKKPGKHVAKNNRIWIVILVVVLIAVLVISVVFLGDKEPSDQVGMPAEQKQDIDRIETVVHTPTPTDNTEKTEQAEVTRKELTIDSVEQSDNMMIVNTSYGAMRYPYAFSDLVEIAAVNKEEQSSLEWYVLLGESKYLMFTVTFNGIDGTLLGTMAVENGKPAEPVYMQFFSADDQLEGADLETFSAVQEILNDVIVSLEDNAGFAAAE